MIKINKINEFLTVLTLESGKVIKLITDPVVRIDKNEFYSSWVETVSLTPKTREKLNQTKQKHKDLVKKWQDESR